MKKILVTTLALSLAVASTINARSQRGTATGEAASQRHAAQNVNGAAAKAEDAPRSEKNAAVQELMAALEDDQSMADLALLEVQHKKILSDLETAQAKLKNIKNGWFRSTDEYKDQAKIVAKLKMDLRDKQRDIAKVRKELTPESYEAVMYGVGAAIVAIGIGAVLEYYMSDTGTAFTEKGFTRTNARAGRKYVGDTYGSVKKGYFPERLGGEPRVVAPAKP